MHQLIRALRARPVIAAARDLAGAKAAAEGESAAIFLLGGSILTLPAMVLAAKSTGKRVFAHLDLLEGLGHDHVAVEWCAKYAKPDGVISTRAPMLRCAGDCGLLTIQRLFVMDSSSLRNGIRQLQKGAPDIVEVLPGLVPKAISQLCMALPKSEIIAGGMVTEAEDVAMALRAGAIGVSTSVEALWPIRREDLGL